MVRFLAGFCFFRTFLLRQKCPDETGKSRNGKFRGKTRLQSGAFEGSLAGQAQLNCSPQVPTFGRALRAIRKTLVGSSRSRHLRIAFLGIRQIWGELGNGVPKGVRQAVGLTRPDQAQLG